MNLAGFPYNILFIEDIVRAKDLSKYSIFIFAQCMYKRSTIEAEATPDSVFTFKTKLAPSRKTWISESAHLNELLQEKTHRFTFPPAVGSGTLTLRWMG